MTVPVVSIPQPVHGRAVAPHGVITSDDLAPARGTHTIEAMSVWSWTPPGRSSQSCPTGSPVAS